MEICKNTKVYILLPTKDATGGLELLHQLVYNLIKIGIDAFLYYPYEDRNPIHESYEKYNNPFCKKIKDSVENILIYPEVYGALPILNKYKNIRKIMWWLSVDNFYAFKLSSSRKNLFFYRLINKLLKIFGIEPVFDLRIIVHRNLKIDNLVKQANMHLVQSYYAMDYLIKAGFDPNCIKYLSDYLNEDFLNIETNLSDKKNVVIFNPKKGIAFTQKILKKVSGLKFIPIINMKREEVIKHLQEAKVYIDFGNHPGKDRIPREAAILGCCVITGKRGSAAFFEDIPIFDEYKFKDEKENITKIIDKINDCLEHFEYRYKDFDHYREIIKQEPKKFLEDLKDVFNRR